MFRIKIVSTCIYGTTYDRYIYIYNIWKFQHLTSLVWGSLRLAPTSLTTLWFSTQSVAAISTKTPTHCGLSDCIILGGEYSHHILHVWHNLLYTILDEKQKCSIVLLGSLFKQKPCKCIDLPTTIYSNRSQPSWGTCRLAMHGINKECIGYTTRWRSLRDIHDRGPQVRGCVSVGTDTELYNQLVPRGIATRLHSSRV